MIGCNKCLNIDLNSYSVLLGLKEEAIESREEVVSSRNRVLNALSQLGVNVTAFEGLTLDQLTGIYIGLLRAQLPGPKDRRQQLDPDAGLLSFKDRQILGMIVSSKRPVSSVQISRKLGMPLTTVQRRRKKLEEVYLESRHELRIDRLGWKTGHVFVSVAAASPAEVGKAILGMPGVISAVRVISGNKIDIIAMVAFRSTAELAEIIGRIRSTAGVQEVSWSEVIGPIGTNSDFIIQTRIDGGKQEGVTSAAAAR